MTFDTLCNIRNGLFPKGEHLILWGQEIYDYLCISDGIIKCIDGSEAFAICSVFLLPPRNIDPPYVSTKQNINGKSFSLYTCCRTCAELQNESTICQCSDNQRAIYTTLCSQEIAFCVHELGYKILEIFGKCLLLSTLFKIFTVL